MKSKEPEAPDFGLKSELLLQLTAVFHTHAEVDSVVLYGSRAKGTYHPGSDIDLSIMGPY